MGVTDCSPLTQRREEYAAASSQCILKMQSAKQRYVTVNIDIHAVSLAEPATRVYSS